MSIRDNDHDPLSEYPHLLHFLCHHSASKTIKAQLAARGERVREYSAMAIRSLAEDYVEANRELLMVEAILKGERSPTKSAATAKATGPAKGPGAVGQGT
jgi:hypothetical protein